MYRLIAVCAAASLATGCGLIDPDIADFDLSLPEKELTVDSADWMLSTDATLPAVPCQAMPMACDTAVQAYCADGESCAGSCDGTNCAVTVGVELWHMFNLALEKPELEQIDGQPLVDVTIERIFYRVTENSFNVDTPPLTIYAAPEAITDTDDGQAEPIGTIPVVSAGTLVADGEVMLTPTGRETMARYLRSYSTPFNIIIGGDIVLSAGDPMPNGRMVTVVGVEAHAGI